MASSHCKYTFREGLTPIAESGSAAPLLHVRGNFELVEQQRPALMASISSMFSQNKERRPGMPLFSIARCVVRLFAGLDKLALKYESSESKRTYVHGYHAGLLPLKSP